MELTEIKSPLSNLQLELLKIFSHNISDVDLHEIKKILVNYFAQKAMDEADEIWENNRWNEEDERKFVNGHLRTPYK